MAGTLTASVVKNDTTSPPAFQNSAGTEVGQLCRAWVNFAGATGTINASFNVSSVTRSSTGLYTVNFANAFADTNYAITGFARKNAVDDANPLIVSANHTYTLTTSAVQIKTVVGAWSFSDGTHVSVAVFR